MSAAAAVPLAAASLIDEPGTDGAAATTHGAPTQEVAGDAMTDATTVVEQHVVVERRSEVRVDGTQVQQQQATVTLAVGAAPSAPAPAPALAAAAAAATEDAPPAVERRKSTRNAANAAPPPPPKRQRSTRSNSKPVTEARDVGTPAAAAASSSAAAAPSVANDALAPSQDVVSEIASNTQEMVMFEADSSSSLIVTEERDEEGALLARTVSETTVVKKRATKRKVKQPPVYDTSNYAPQALVSRNFIGAHVSAAGGPQHAVFNASLIGARAFAMDLRYDQHWGSKRKWTSPPMDEEDAKAFRNALKEFHYTPDQVLPHGSYLMNLGSPNAEVLAKSKKCLREELERCGALGIHLYNFHPGSTCGEISKEECCARIASALNEAHKLTAHLNGGRGCVTVLENMAGQGGVVGVTFEELKSIIDAVEDKSRVGVCIDTCHAFAAGIDLRTAEDVRAMLRRFDEVVGLKYLRGLHLNDSKGALNCRKDRHESIGRGCVGSECFRALLNSPEIAGLPLILETPCPDLKQARAKYANEIAMLYAMEEGALPDDRAGYPLEYVEPTEEELEEQKSKHKEKLAQKRINKAAKAAEEGEEEEEAEGEPEEEDDEPPLTLKQRGRAASAPSVKRQRSAGKTAAAAPAAPPALKRRQSKQKKQLDEEEEDEAPPAKPTVKRRKSAGSKQKQEEE